MKKYLVVLLLAGCAGQTATWTGGKPENLQSDLSACRSENPGGLAFGMVGATAGEIAMEKCMNQRGWIGKYPENQPPK